MILMSVRARVCLAACVWLAASTNAFGQAPAAPPPGDWEGSGGAGVSLTSGNSDTVNFNLALDLTHDPMTRNVMKFKALYLRGEQDDEIVVNRTTLGFRDQYALTSRMFVFGQIDYLRDTFKLIDYLVAPTGGLGYKVVDTEATKFDVTAGAGAVWEKNPDIDVRTDVAITAGESLQHRLSDTALLKHAVTALWKADDFEDGLYTISVGVATDISPRVQLTFDVVDTYKNLPPTPETKKNDVAIVTAIAAKF